MLRGVVNIVGRSGWRCFYVVTVAGRQMEVMYLGVGMEFLMYADRDCHIGKGILGTRVMNLHRLKSHSRSSGLGSVVTGVVRQLPFSVLFQVTWVE